MVCILYFLFYYEKKKKQKIICQLQWKMIKTENITSLVLIKLFTVWLKSLVIAEAITKFVPPTDGAFCILFSLFMLIKYHVLQNSNCQTCLRMRKYKNFLVVLDNFIAALWLSIKFKTLLAVLFKLEFRICDKIKMFAIIIVRYDKL